MSKFKQRWRGAVSFVGIGVKDKPRMPDSLTPTITTGANPPSAAEPNGSIYLRVDAADADQAIYARIGGSWVALSGT